MIIGGFFVRRIGGCLLGWRLAVVGAGVGRREWAALDEEFTGARTTVDRTSLRGW